MGRYLIVGAGVFGLSTAYHLLLEGEKDVHVIDKSEILPAPDAASVDINRIVRTAYGNPLYAKLAREAIEKWKTDFPGVYHESGVLVIGDSKYAKAAQLNDEAAGELVAPTEGTEAIRASFPDVQFGSFGGHFGYLSTSNGWADAEGGMKALLRKVIDLGGSVKGGQTAASLLFKEDGVVRGVKTLVGDEITADVVIVATGAWTPSWVTNSCSGVVARITATGQSVACIQLTESEAECYRGVPVVLNFSTGFYVFPPNRDHLLKMAIHDGGHTYVSASCPDVSSPRTVSSHGEAGLWITRVMANKLRANLVDVYPEFGDRPFCKTRLCWYADTEDEDWLIDQHPDHPGLYFATAGNGHAYKFLPILGRLVVQRIKGRLPLNEAKTFAFDRDLAARHDPELVDRLRVRRALSDQDEFYKV